MDSYSTTDPSQDLNSLLGGTSGEPLIPESLTIFLVVCFVIINILTILFFIFWIMGMVRRWKVQTAVLHMQKDIAEIKQVLAKPAQQVPVVESVVTQPQESTPSQPIQPDDSTR